MQRGEVLGQGAEIGVVTDVPGQRWLRLDGLDPRAIVAPQRELVEKLPHGVPKVLSVPDPLRHRHEGLRQTLSPRRMGDEPVRARGQNGRHEPGW